MTTLYLDTETFGLHDIKSVGTYRHAETCEVLLLSYAFDDEPVQCWDAANGAPMPRNLRNALRDDNVIVTAHNSMYDRNVLRHALGLEVAIPRWRDTMVKAYTLGLPGALEALGAALGLPADKAKLSEGKKLISRFCKPAPKNHKADRYDRISHPEEWARFTAYAMQDVEAMREVDKRLPDWVYRGQELDYWHLDQVVNDRGLPVDIEAAKAAVRLVERAVADLNEELRVLTFGTVRAATEVNALRDWLYAQGVQIPDMTKGTVLNTLRRKTLPAQARRALEIRQQVGKTSTAKYTALINAASEDGRLRGSLQFYGASRTGRYAGRKFQPQNLPWPHRDLDDITVAMDAVLNNTTDLLYALEAMEIASSCVRSAICAPQGRKLNVADLSNIEGRKLAWLAGEEWKLEAFRAYDAGTGPDLYKLAYARSFNVRPEDVDKNQRQIGKVQELALGYQGAVGAFNSMAANYGVQLPEEEVRQIVDGWRGAHPATVSYWYDTERAAIAAVDAPGRTFLVRRVMYAVRAHAGRKWLLCKLPSGRMLAYFEPRVKLAETKFGPKRVLSYMGVDTYTKAWTRIPTYGGKLVENQCQGSARDVLMYSMPAMEAEGFEIVGSVHDEAISETDDTPAFKVQCLEHIMARVPPWAEGLPLAAEGFETRRYKK